MRILLANASAYPLIGGVENSLCYIGRELLRAGHEVKIFCLQSSPGLALRDYYEGIEIIRVPYSIQRWPNARIREMVAAAQRGIGAVLAAFNPDAVWSRSANVGLGIRRGGYAGPLLQIFSTNARMHCRGIYLQSHGMPWKRRLMLRGLWAFEYFPSARGERELARQCTPVAFSRNMQQQLLSDFPAGSRTCHIIPPGVDTDVFSPESGARHFDMISAKFGLKPGAPIVLYVGRLSSHKNIPLLIDAVAALKTPAQLVLVGDGTDQQRFADYSARLGLGDRVIFAGPQREMLPGFYALSRVSVLPTITESFGQVYIESMACGTPAVGFAGDGRRVLTATSEIIRDGDTGGVAREISARALAAKIDDIVTLDHASYAAMALRAREVARTRYSWERFVEEALKISV